MPMEVAEQNPPPSPPPPPPASAAIPVQEGPPVSTTDTLENLMTGRNDVNNMTGNEMSHPPDSPTEVKEDEDKAAAAVTKAAVEHTSSMSTSRMTISQQRSLEGDAVEGSEIGSYRGFSYRQYRESTLREDGDMQLARLVRRGLPFSQSRNRVNVQNNHGLKIFQLIRHDWFHVILRYPTGLCLLILLSIWTLVVTSFAGVYVAVDNRQPAVDCGLGKIGSPIQFGQSFAFALETATTVGYGLPNGSNAFFENCPELQVVIYIQMVFTMFFNAFLFAFFFTQVASADNRGAQVLFSEKAIVSIVDGQVRFQIRVFDIDASLPVVKAHVRLYVVAKSRPVPRSLRLLQPNDELGRIIFLSLPLVISHHIDIYSLLHPPRMAPINPSGLQLRQADSYIGNREEYTCPICGEGYVTALQLKEHIEYYAGIERDEDYPVTGTHLSIPEHEYKESTSNNKFKSTMDMDELRDYFLHEVSEVVCVVEGTEPISSGTFRGIQSYTFDDVVFKADADFAPCVRVKGMDTNSKNKQPGYISIDLDRFHKIDNL